ncbi:MAG: hypothetical protein KDD40_11605, partial [Bdellovibrionales bacterium]|nr:hypothetical protein [Bdellovibrionales bacterium]
YSNAKEINKTIQNISDYVQKYCSPTEADMRERLGINPLLQLAHTSSMDRHNNTNPRDFKRESTCSHCTQKLQIGDEVK